MMLMKTPVIFEGFLVSSVPWNFQEILFITKLGYFFRLVVDIGIISKKKK